MSVVGARVGFECRVCGRLDRLHVFPGGLCEGFAVRCGPDFPCKDALLIPTLPALVFGRSRACVVLLLLAGWAGHLCPRSAPAPRAIAPLPDSSTDKLMLLCWRKNPASRPTFSHMASVLLKDEPPPHKASP